MFRRKLPRDHITQGQGLSEVSARLSRLMKWCPGQGSNLHAGITRRGILSPLCLPVSPPGPSRRKIVPEGNWRRGSESNRRPRLCRPLHDHSATPPHTLTEKRSSDDLRAWAVPRDSGAGDESRTRDLNLGKVTLYQLSYSRGRRNLTGRFPCGQAGGDLLPSAAQERA